MKMGDWFPCSQHLHSGYNAEKTHSSLMDSMLRIFTGGAGVVGIHGTGKLGGKGVQQSGKSRQRWGGELKKSLSSVRESGFIWGKKEPNSLYSIYTLKICYIEIIVSCCLQLQVIPVIFLYMQNVHLGCKPCFIHKVNNHFFMLY